MKKNIITPTSRFPLLALLKGEDQGEGSPTTTIEESEKSPFPLFPSSPFLILILLAFFSVFSGQNSHAAGFAAVQGIYIDGSTNTVSVAGVNTNVCVVAASCTNTFNMSNVLNAQANTNVWPAMPFFPAFGTSGRLLCLHTSYSMIGTNSTNSILTFRFAGSTDGSRWTSNYMTFNATTTSTNVLNVMTNLDMYSAPFIALQSIENTNSTTLVTNLQIDASYKFGF